MGFREFRERWIVLREDSIAYYHSNAAGEAMKGCIPMHIVDYVAPNAEMKTYGFTVYAGEEPELCYEFSCKDAVERDEWIDAVSDILAARGKDRRRTSTT